VKINGELPLVSVVISTYYSVPTIGQVLEALLKQNYPLKRIEVIIVDGASTDDTIKIVKKFAENYAHLFHDFKVIIHEKNMGVSKARNDGIKASNGDFILILDSDVVLPSSAIREMVEFLTQRPDVGCLMLLLVDDYTNLVTRWVTDLYYNKIKTSYACTAAALIRREVVEKAGLYNETLGPPFTVDEDIEYGVRIWRAGYKCLLYGRLTATHLAATRDRYLAKTRGASPKDAEIRLFTLLKWFIGYARKKQALSWWKVLSSMPLQMKLKFYVQSLFVPALILFIVFFIIGEAYMATFWGLTTLLLFLTSLYEFFDLKRFHKALLIALLSSFNRSMRTLSAVLYRIITFKRE